MNSTALNAPSEQVKMEFESIKSLISEGAGGTTLAVNDFCKHSIQIQSVDLT